MYFAIYPSGTLTLKTASLYARKSIGSLLPLKNLVL